MIDIYADLPEDIAAEKRAAVRLKRKYKGALFGAIRNFRALRSEAPGVIVEFMLAAILSIVVLLVVFHDLDVTGLFPVIGACLKMLVIVGLCFWSAGRIWRAIGPANRDRCRYVVSNMWSLALTAMLVASVIGQLFFPALLPTPQEASSQTKNAATTPPSEFVTAKTLTQVLPVTERVYSGSGWRILHDEKLAYDTSLVKEAPGRCGALGENWVLAHPTDFEELEPVLRQSGHVGSFWTASNKPNSNLDFFLDADGGTRYRWANSGTDTERIVLCVFAVSI